MKNKWMATMAVFLFLVLLSAIGQQVNGEPPLPNGRRLKQIVAENFPDGNVFIGGTTGWRKRPKGAGQILDREFSYITPENDFKQRKIHPRPNVWNWEEADAWVEHCQKIGQTCVFMGQLVLSAQIGLKKTTVLPKNYEKT